MKKLLLTLSLLTLLSCSSENQTNDESVKVPPVESPIIPPIESPKVDPNIITRFDWSESKSSVRISGEIKYVDKNTILESGICWSTSSNPGYSLPTKIVYGKGIYYFNHIIPELKPNTTYYVKAFAQTITRITYGNEINFTSLKETNLEIGQKYEGGIIVDFFLPGDEKYEISKIKGLIALEKDLQDGIFPSTLVGMTGPITDTRPELGYGLSNSTKLAGGNEHANTICLKLTANGYNDWFLPSQNELAAVWKAKGLVGGFKNAVYWSSTTRLQSHGWAISFPSGGGEHILSSYNCKVRPVRYFILN